MHYWGRIRRPRERANISPLPESNESYPSPLEDGLKREGEGKAGPGARSYLFQAHWNGFPTRFPVTLPLKPSLGHPICPLHLAHWAVLAGLFCASVYPQMLLPSSPSSPSYPFTPEASPSQSGLSQALFYTTGTLPLQPLNWWNRGRSLFARDQPPPHALTLGSLQALLLMMLGGLCQQFSSIMENPFMDLSLTPVYLSREGNGDTPGVQGEGRTNGVPLSTIAIAMKAQLRTILFYLWPCTAFIWLCNVRVYSSAQQIFVDSLLWAGHWAKRYNSEQEWQMPPLLVLTLSVSIFTESVG